MKLIIAIIQPEELPDIKEELLKKIPELLVAHGLKMRQTKGEELQKKNL